MGDPFQGVLDGMGEVVEGIDAPLIPLTVMMGPDNPIDGRIPHVHIGGGHVDFGPQGAVSIRELPVFHLFKKGQVFLYRTVPIRAFLTRLGQGAPVFPHLLGA